MEIVISAARSKLSFLNFRISIPYLHDIKNIIPQKGVNSQLNMRLQSLFFTAVEKGARQKIRPRISTRA